MCDQRPVHAVRDHPGPRPGHGRGAVRLQQAVRRGARRARRSTCGSRRRSSCRSRCPRARPTSGSCSSPTCCPTAWQSVVYADVPKGGTLLVLGLGPIGDMATRIALHQGFRVIAVDLVPERLARAQAPRRRGDRPATRSTTSPRRSARAPRAGAPTRSSTRSAWRRTARRSPRSASGSSTRCPKRSPRRIMSKVGPGPDGGDLHRDRRGAPRRHGLAHRRVRRPDATRCRC